MVDQFRPLVKRALAQHITDLIAERLKSAMKSINEDSQAAATREEAEATESPEEESGATRVETTATELEAFYLIKSFLRKEVAAERITYKDTATYFSVLLAGNVVGKPAHLSPYGKHII
ncbi:MAG: hypothetical protein H0Z37_11010 [Firmicutes bacterium]|nr:hypothetical protein [Bacillota bacterium]